MTVSAETLEAAARINYRVSFSEPQAHYADVEMRISGLRQQTLDLKMPVWAPGSYLVREFARNVETFAVRGNENKVLSSGKINKNTWRIQLGNSHEITVTYRVYAFEISVRTSFIDASHAFLSPTGIFMYPDGQIDQPLTVEIEPAENWKKISTGLDAVRGKANTFYAPDFDILYDSPIEVGNQDTFGFSAAGVEHEVAMYGGGNYDKARLARDMALLVETETAIFGENPNKRYVFIVHNFQSGGGGLEHLNSTVLGAKRTGYAHEETYKDFLSLVAHEYFHLWNVKRLRPKALGPFNYDQENYTSDLWISEGFTAYYDNMILRRSGFYSPERYLQVLSGDIGTVENQPGNKIQALSEASFDAWIKYYRPNENSRNATVSYYTKGAVLAMLIDLEIIAATNGRKSLDDVMKAMYDEYYKKQKRGFTDAEFKTMAEKVAGRSLTRIYEQYVHGTEPINYNASLGAVGVYLINELAGTNNPYLGVSATNKDGRLMITSVARGSAAWKDGLNVNDEIIGIDGYRITGAVDPALKASDLDRAVGSRKVGDKLSVLVSRDGVLQTHEVTLTANPNGRFRLEIDSDATAEQVALRKKWLKMDADFVK